MHIPTSTPATRQWEGEICQCSENCGDCCLVFWLPFLPLWQNRKRTFPNGSIIWGLLAFLAWLALPVVYFVPWVFSNLEPLTKKRCKKDCLFCEEECTEIWGWLWYTLWFGSLFVFLVIGMVTRVQIRNKLLLPGEMVTDIVQWLFCCWCSLNQELKTLKHNRVEGGYWQGPLPIAAVVMGSQPTQGYPMNSATPFAGQPAGQETVPADEFQTRTVPNAHGNMNVQL